LLLEAGMDSETQCATRTDTNKTLLSPVLAGLVTLISTAIPARAQTLPRPPGSPPHVLQIGGVESPTDDRPWDAALVGGFFAGRPEIPEPSDYQQRWFRTGQAAVIVGRHLTPHVKAEFELATTAEGRLILARYLTLPNGATIPYGAERRSTTRGVSASVIWQFRDNEWVHPFVHAGVATDVDRVSTHTWRQPLYISDPRAPGAPAIVIAESDERSDTTRTCLVIGGGTKIYLTPHTFLRTDGRLATGGSGQHLAFRIGFGAEF
jgi:hypothetical protein